MLAGKTPFEGDYKDVMEAHKNLPPPLLAAKKVRRKIKNLIYSGMSKDPGRPACIPLRLSPANFARNPRVSAHCCGVR